MKTTKTTSTSLRNEEILTKPANLPSGTFSRDGQPTIVTMTIALLLVLEMRKNPGSTKFNTPEFRNMIVDHLDSLHLLPRNASLTRQEKAIKIGMAIKYMLTETETIQTKHLNIYTACKSAMKRSISQLKIAESAS